ncbi:hypothetical protein [Roseovarius ramblicola]|uniref:DUF4760 domain-containing protein n=1 Tax=Roseovarius ramblicola TaxID=2022336 RepID=A0ABV5I066_9RHOB
MFNPAEYSLDAAKLVISILTPITVAFVGYFLNQRLKSIDNAQWQSRKITEKRIELYDDIAPDLNKVFCFCTFLGYWKDISPQDVLTTKRNLDKKVNIYRHLLSDDFYELYNEFIHLAFTTFTGWGEDAKIQAWIANGMADRRIHANYKWEAAYDDMFQENTIASSKKFQQTYFDMMNALRNCIGLDE